MYDKNVLLPLNSKDAVFYSYLPLIGNQWQQTNTTNSALKWIQGQIIT